MKTAAKKAVKKSLVLFLVMLGLLTVTNSAAA